MKAQMASAKCVAVCGQWGLVLDGARPCGKAGIGLDGKTLTALKTESITHEETDERICETNH